jgi:uracil-DNA glycosylase
VALGRIAFDVWLRLVARRGVKAPSPKPVFAHGAVATAGNPDRGGRVLIGCYHPSRQNTNTGRLTASMMDDVFSEARRLLR